MFVRSYNPIWYFVDLQGLQLNDTDYLFILNNEFPYNTQPIFQDPDGTIPWNDPIQFFPNGTLPDNMYWDPTLVYRLEIRAGNSQADQLIYLIENYVPSGQNSPTPVTIANAVANQITNPQFFDINFVSPLVISTAGTYNIGPGWQLVLTGTGPVSATITQRITTINQASPTDPVPAYALELNLFGWSSVILQQPLQNLGNIWNNQFLFMSVLVESNNGVSSPITLQYNSTSATATVVPIVTGASQPLLFTTIAGSVKLPSPFASTASNFGSTVLLQIVLPGTSDTIISNVQAMPQAVQISSVPFEQETLERQEDHLFHYFENSILIQPKDNLLCGWNFPLNPTQFGTINTGTIATVCDYLQDQTILRQQTASSVSAINTSGLLNFDTQVQAVTAGNQFALIQYIAPQTIEPYWSQSGFIQNLSSLVRLAHTGASPVNFKMRLIWRTENSGLPPTISNTEPIASWSSGNDPAFASGWTEIKPLNDPTYTSSTVMQSFDFNQFVLPAAAASPNNPGTLGIVLYTISNMATPGSVIFDRISLVPNDFAIDCNTRTFDDELQKCQYYFETSFDPGVFLGDLTTNVTGPIYNGTQNRVQMTGITTNTFAYPLDFNLSYKNVKNRLPTVLKLYSPQTGIINKVYYELFAGGSFTANDITFPGGAAGNTWTSNGFGLEGASWFATVSGNGLFGASPGTTLPPTGSVMYFQYFVDARLGKP